LLDDLRGCVSLLFQVNKNCLHNRVVYGQGPNFGSVNARIFSLKVNQGCFGCSQTLSQFGVVG
jgi:hypothetical protein